ncbi:hypothetical protein PXH69_24480 [Rhodococcus qingshengii]|uniref:Head-tail adaptor protein n=1 Tax=Rhodococcus qingshengii TaxID=334542 RepID=A0AAW6LUN6_RHOSG|nr:hypothetical protein [Rhodococcus qingshengii]MDE8648128.1 hypothetical protein [Rhodococcus qingshengii]
MKPIESYPFDPQRNCMRTTADAWGSMIVEWRPNTPFEATMQVESIVRGRSSTELAVVDTKTATRYWIPLRAFETLLLEGEIKKGLIEGTWHIEKRSGGYFGLVPVKVA